MSFQILQAILDVTAIALFVVTLPGTVEVALVVIGASLTKPKSTASRVAVGELKREGAARPERGAANADRSRARRSNRLGADIGKAVGGHAGVILVMEKKLSCPPPIFTCGEVKASVD